MKDLLNRLVKDDKKHKVLIITSKKDENILKAIGNIDYAKPLAADSLNVLDLLSFKYLLLDKESIKVIEKTYIEKTKNHNLNDKK
jgi:ribosomal protein L4